MNSRKTSVSAKPASPSPTTARQLLSAWGIPARHALYHNEGKWYHRLERFPAALLDQNGYVVFTSKEAYLESKYLRHGKHLNVRGGIRQIPEYVLVSTDLPKNGAAVLKRIVKHLDSESVRPGHPETYIGYKRIHDDLGLTLKAATYGESLNRQGLGSLAEWTKKNGYPAITGLVVDTETRLPGGGYFNLFKPSEDQFSWWENEVRKSLRFDWHAFLDREDPTPLPTPPAADLAPPGRIKTTTYRILRDTELARAVKEECRFACQICGHTLTLPSGAAYAEAHHIKPLGKPHRGPDVEENILCVCPNHHAALDYGVIRLERMTLGGGRTRAASEKFIQYHNQKIFGKTCDSEAV
jgi:hypothetical protein